jgi:selenocysteine lyase/cysteine desulfurase
MEWNKAIKEAIDDSTILVALGNVHWTDGTLFDLKAIGEKTRSVGAYYVIDGTQSIGALPFDISEIQPDALVCAGYKWLMGPYSIGLAYFNERFTNGIPIEENWLLREDSEDFSQLVNYKNAYQPGAVRFDVGERSNFILVPMMKTALQQIIDWGVSNIQDYCRALSDELTDGLNALGYKIEDPACRAGHIFGIRLPDHIKTEVAKLKFQEKNISVSFRGSAIRVAPNVYNTSDDIGIMRSALIELVE